MRIRVWTWVLVLGLSVPAIGGCPGGSGVADGGVAGTNGGDGDGDGDGDGGASGVAGDGDGDGDGPAGGGGTGGGSSDLPPEAVLAGACGMMDGTGADQLPECADLDAYSSCVNGCGYDTCINGACSDLISCVESAPDPCNHGCEPSAECENCFATVDQNCAYSCLMTHLLCTDEGGACDQAPACCDSVTDPMMMMQCTQTLSLTMSLGDIACQSVIDTYCPGSGG